MPTFFVVCLVWYLDMCALYDISELARSLLLPLLKNIRRIRSYSLVCVWMCDRIQITKWACGFLLPVPHVPTTRTYHRTCCLVKRAPWQCAHRAFNADKCSFFNADKCILSLKSRNRMCSCWICKDRPNAYSKASCCTRNMWNRTLKCIPNLALI